jgi:hypothetical protein
MISQARMKSAPSSMRRRAPLIASSRPATKLVGRSDRFLSCYCSRPLCAEDQHKRACISIHIRTGWTRSMIVGLRHTNYARGFGASLLESRRPPSDCDGMASGCCDGILGSGGFHARALERLQRSSLAFHCATELSRGNRPSDVSNRCPIHCACSQDCSWAD